MTPSHLLDIFGPVAKIRRQLSRHADPDLLLATRAKRPLESRQVSAVPVGSPPACARARRSLRGSSAGCLRLAFRISWARVHAPRVASES